MASLRGFEFGQHGIDHIHVIAVKNAFCDTQGFNVGVFDQKFQFVLLVIGVDGDLYGSQISLSLEKSQPVGDVGGPNTHMRPLSDTDSHQAFGHIIYSLVKLLVRKAQVSVRIDQVFTIGGVFGPMIQKLP